jgi:hypothetical protein
MRLAEGRLDRLPGLAEELVREDAAVRLPWDSDDTPPSTVQGPAPPPTPSFLAAKLTPKMDGKSYRHLGADIVALIVNAFIGAVVLLLILRVGGGWGRRRDGVGAGSRLKSSSSAISAHVLSPLLN